MKFLRNLLAAILGCLVAFGIVFLMFFVFAALVGSGDDGVQVKPNSVLELSFSEPIYDYVGKDPNDPFGDLFDEAQGLDELIHAIKVATNDDKIQGISLAPSFTQAGMAQTQEIRRAIASFKEAGKFVTAYADFYGQKDYWLASIADEIYLNPQGVMDFKGLLSEVLYYKDLQEKTGLKMEVIRHGKYKSAVEPFLSDTMSDNNRAQIKSLLMSVWTTMLEDIAASRNKTVAELNTIADTLGARLPKYAVSNGLLDGLLFQDEYDALLNEKLGKDSDAKLNTVELEDYVKVAKKTFLTKGASKIAVIYAQGEILYGEGSKDVIGQGTINKALKKARENDNIKAVVLRVNSPGGSSLVSDIILREVALTKAVKPVVVSYGDVAASGGYYISVASDKIFAEPTTITGSIGVFGTIPNAHELATDIGINAEQVGTNKNSLDYSIFEPMSDAFRAQVKEGIEEVYTTFINHVADGRAMTPEAVDAVAQGRVWSGVEAVEVGLVDELGGLDDAITAAAQLAELEEYGIRKYPRYKSEFERLMGDLSSAKSTFISSMVKEELGDETFEALQSLKSMTEQKGIQARMPYQLNIK